MNKQSIRGFIIFISLLFCYAVLANAGQKLVWDPSEGADVKGYRIYYGTSSGKYTQQYEAGTATECALSNLSLAQNAVYYFAVRAFNNIGESVNSNEISWTASDSTPPIPPQGITVK